MNKKLIAVAVAAALGAPALAQAQASTVTVTGKFYLEYDAISPGKQNATQDFVNIDKFQNPGSNIALSGTESLGGGLSAWFQCESTADFTGALPVGFCGRNSAVGLKGNFGSVYFGNWDTPFKRSLGVGAPVGDTGIWGAAFLLAGSSTSVNDRASPTVWKRRQNNSINYDTPVFSGFQLSASTTTTGGAVSATTTQTGAKPRLYSLGATYTNGPLAVSAGYEIHKNFQVTGAGYSSNDTGWQVGAQYQAGPIKVGGTYTKQNMDLSATSDGSVGAWAVGVDWAVQGPHSLKATYTKANDTSGTGTFTSTTTNRVFNAGAGNTGASLVTVQYTYTLSKRSNVGVGFAELRNNANATYSLGGAAVPLAGQNQSGAGAFITHSF